MTTALHRLETFSEALDAGIDLGGAEVEDRHVIARRYPGLAFPASRFAHAGCGQYGL
jgi:hypothetical protein